MSYQKRSKWCDDPLRSEEWSKEVKHFDNTLQAAAEAVVVVEVMVVVVVVVIVAVVAVVVVVVVMVVVVVLVVVAVVAAAVCSVHSDAQCHSPSLVIGDR